MSQVHQHRILSWLMCMLVMFNRTAAVEKAAIFKVGTGQKVLGRGGWESVERIGSSIFQP